MKRLLIIGLTGCAFELVPTMSASAMPAATPYTLGGADGAVIRSKAATGMGGAIRAVAATTMVGIAGTTMVGGIIAIGGDTTVSPLAHNSTGCARAIVTSTCD